MLMLRNFSKKSFTFKSGPNKCMLKGLQVAGTERGLWDRDGKIDGKKVLLDEMRSVKAPRKRSVGKISAKNLPRLGQTGRGATSATTAR